MGINSIDGGKGELALTFSRKVQECKVVEADEFGVSVRVEFSAASQDETTNEDLEKKKKVKKTFAYGVCYRILCHGMCYFFI